MKALRLQTHPITLLFLGTLVLLLLLAASCGSTRCQRASDCPAQQVCKDQRCQAQQSCDPQRDDCGPQETCVNQRCQPIPSRSCESHFDCPGKQRCEPNTQLCVACLTDDDCPSPLRCSPKHQCTDSEGALPTETPSTEAPTDSGTPPEASTENTPPEANTETTAACNQDDDCPPGQHCQNQQCSQGRRPCQSASACQSGYTCDAKGLCTRTTCRQSADCPTGQRCNTTTQQCASDPNDCTLTGCPTGQQCNLTTRQCENASSQSCTSDSDCAAPAGTCNNGSCQSCASQFSCPTGLQCNLATGRCQNNSSGSCSSNADCTAPNGTCRNSTCQSCSTDFTCATGKCDIVNGVCVSSNTCNADSDCAAPSATCRNNTCQSCATDFSCATNEICQSSTGLCTTAAGCTADRDCAIPNGTCYGGTCRSCVYHFSCITGQVCNRPSGRCVTPAGSCSSHADCSSSQYCKSGSCTAKECDPQSSTLKCPFGKLCKDFVCVPDPNAGCTTNSQCKSGEYCKGGICYTRECDTLTPCPESKTCRGHRCVANYSRCVSVVCGAARRCLQDPDDDQSCHFPCSTPGSSCPTGGTCQSVATLDGSKQNLCLYTNTLKLSDSCTPGDLQNQCPSGSICFHGTSSSKGRCTALCALSSGTCKSTEQCVELSPGKGLCLPKGSGYTGGTCYLGSSRCSDKNVCIPSRLDSNYGTCRARCSSSTPCSSSSYECTSLPFTNQYGACLSNLKTSLGSTCYNIPYSRCKDGLGCAFDPFKPDTGVCLQQCKQSTDCTSSSTPECREGFCRPKGSTSENSSCKTNSTSAYYTCKTGLVCIPSTTSSSYYCRKPCNFDSQCSSSQECRDGICLTKGSASEGSSCSFSTCKKGLLCLYLSSTSTSRQCFKPCNTNTECSSTQECFSGICLTKGTAAEGEYCSTSLSSASSRCQSPLICTYPPSSFSRKCVALCSSDTDCTGKYKKCSPVSNVGNVCYQ